MQFGNPGILSLLWLVPALGLFYYWSFRQKDVLLKTFCNDEKMRRKLLRTVSRKQQVLKAVLVVAAAALAIVALGRPRWGFRWEEVKRKGVEIVVAMDVSQSMMARDVDPNRLERAKREVTDLVRMLRGDKVGLVTFAGSSFIECPLTLDYGAFSLFLDALSPDMMPVPGTALADALRTSLSAFDKGPNVSKAVILITDGEDHEGSVSEAAEQAKAQGVKIFTVGIGNAEGTPIPSGDATGGFKKDSTGGVVLSKLDQKTLENIALTTGGAYVHSATGDMDLKTIYLQGIRREMKDREFASTRTKKWKERFQWPLLAALLCLMAGTLVRETRKEDS
jgi:Ca-activated chloride channel homolog